MAIWKFSHSGSLLWRSLLATEGYDYGYGIAADSQGNIYACGFTTGTFDNSLTPAKNTANLDTFIVQFSSNGMRNWVTQLASRENMRAFFCTVNAQDTLFVFGDLDGFLSDLTAAGTGSRDLFLLTYDPTGKQRWGQQFGSPQADLAFAAGHDAEGNIYMTGMTRGAFAEGSNTPSDPDVFVASYSPSGQQRWVRQIGAVGGQSGETLSVDGSGVYVLFYTNGSFAGVTNNSRDVKNKSDDMVIVKYSLQGDLLWLQQFAETTERIFARGIVTDGNTVYVLRDHVSGELTPQGGVYAKVSLDTFKMR